MSKKLVKLFKRPARKYQDQQTFSVSREEFIDMAQGRIDRILVHDQYDMLRIKLKVEDILKKALITLPDYSENFYVVDYSPLKKRDIPLEKRRMKPRNKFFIVDSREQEELVECSDLDEVPYEW